MEWFEKIGLSDSCNLIKYKKIDGETIIKADEEYLNDTLGITRSYEQQKFRYKLSKAKEGKVGK